MAEHYIELNPWSDHNGGEGEFDTDLRDHAFMNADIWAYIARGVASAYHTMYEGYGGLTDGIVGRYNLFGDTAVPQGGDYHPSEYLHNITQQQIYFICWAWSFVYAMKKNGVTKNGRKYAWGRPITINSDPPQVDGTWVGNFPDLLPYTTVIAHLFNPITNAPPDALSSRANWYGVLNRVHWELCNMRFIFSPAAYATLQAWTADVETMDAELTSTHPGVRCSPDMTSMRLLTTDGKDPDATHVFVPAEPDPEQLTQGLARRHCMNYKRSSYYQTTPGTPTRVYTNARGVQIAIYESGDETVTQRTFEDGFRVSDTIPAEHNADLPEIENWLEARYPFHTKPNWNNAWPWTGIIIVNGASTEYWLVEWDIFGPKQPNGYPLRWAAVLRQRIYDVQWLDWKPSSTKGWHYLTPPYKYAMDLENSLYEGVLRQGVVATQNDVAFAASSPPQAKWQYNKHIRHSGSGGVIYERGYEGVGLPIITRFYTIYKDVKATYKISPFSSLLNYLVTVNLFTTSGVSWKIGATTGTGTGTYSFTHNGGSGDTFTLPSMEITDAPSPYEIYTITVPPRFRATNQWEANNGWYYEDKGQIGVVVAGSSKDKIGRHMKFSGNLMDNYKPSEFAGFLDNTWYQPPDVDVSTDDLNIMARAIKGRPFAEATGYAHTMGYAKSTATVTMSVSVKVM